MCSSVLWSQDLKMADKYFDYGNFEEALPIYEEALETSDDKIELNYRIGVCYLNSNIDKSKAIPFLEKIKDEKEANPNALFLLARAYQYGYDFDKAIATYNQFAKNNVGNEDNLQQVGKQIEYCENAKEYMKFPLNVDIENLGENINSAYPDYFPFVPADESFLVFNSRRENGEEMPNGQFTSDLYMSKVVDGEFSKARRLGEHINSNELNEEVVGLTADGSKLVMFKDKFDGTGDLYVSRVADMRIDKPMKLDKMINSKYTEIAASISADGKSIYFASDKPGGKGGTDLYVSRILPNGKWSPAQNLGPTINTEYDEDFPNISPDGKTLFFSSKGHTSMGGYDIFKATWDGQKRKFTGVENLRSPINTPDDDMNFMISENGRYGYMSSLRADGFGDTDIYRITFNEVEPKFTVISGTIKTPSGKNVDADKVYMAVIDKQTDEVYGDYKPNPNNNRFVIILPPGNFEINLEVDGFEFFVEELVIKDKSGYKSFISKDLMLKK